MVLVNNLRKLCNLGGIVILLGIALAACSSPIQAPGPTVERPVADPTPTAPDTTAPEPTLVFPLEEPEPTTPDTPTPEPTRGGESEQPTATPVQSGLIIDIQVSDNRQYQKAVMTVGESVFVDRNYTFTHIPAVLEGQEFIRTANDDKDVTTEDFLTFTLTEDATVYVLYDMRSINAPEWLDDGSWEITNHFVVTDDIIRRVYQKAFPAGEVTLGGNAQPPAGGPLSNYNVAARPADSPPPESSLASEGGVEFSVTHAVYNEAMLSQYLEGGQLARYVQPQDSFMLLSGNNAGDIDTELLNSWAATLRDLYPTVTLYAATSGINNVSKGAPGLDPDLFAGLMMVYEPNQENAPEFSWEMAQTRPIWEEAASMISSAGLEPWGKPSGRSLPGGTYFGDWDYGVLAAVMSGINIQTQGRCRLGELNDAMPYLIQQYREAQTDSDLFVQVTVSAGATNYADPEDAIFCAQSGWAYPEVDGVTMWWSPESADQAERFLELREERFLSEEAQTATTVPDPTATPVPTPEPTPTPAPQATPTPAPTEAPAAAPDSTPASTGVPIAAPEGSDGEGQFNEPRGIAIETQGNKIYVADTGNHRIQVFNQTGLFLFQWGSRGSGPGQFEDPSDIEVDSVNGKVYVADTGNHRIQVFTTSGVFLFQWGSQGSGPGQFEEPNGIAVNLTNGKVYVADTGNDRVQVFNGSGTFFFAWGERGNGEGQFKGPSDVAVDPQTSRVYVVDTGNHKIQVLYENGIFIERWGRRGDIPGRFRSPSNIELHPLNNYLYITDTDNHRVQVLDIAGGFVFQWVIPSDGENQFSELIGIAADPNDGNVYMADAGNHRVRVFSQGGTNTFRWGE
jgi:DNA-binding beta-propeller fold protein YncE